MLRMIVNRMISLGVTVLASVMLSASIAGAVSIPVGDLDPFTLPCNLNLTAIGPNRMLSWDSIAGATHYKVGYRLCNGTIVGLADLKTTSYVHVSNDPSACYEYVMVAYGSNEARICSAHATAGNCPCSE